MVSNVLHFMPLDVVCCSLRDLAKTLFPVKKISGGHSIHGRIIPTEPGCRSFARILQHQGLSLVSEIHHAEFYLDVTMIVAL